METRNSSINPRSVECCSVCPVSFISLNKCSISFSHLHIWLWSSSRVTICFLVTTITMTLLHQLLSLPLRIMEAIWTFNATDFFYWNLPRSVLTQSFFWALLAVLLTSGLGFCSDTLFQLLDLYRQLCLSKSCPVNLICHRLTQIEV